MAKLKLGVIEDDRPMKVTLELPAAVHRDLVAYAEVLAKETGRPAGDPIKLIAPMIERFMATDRGFAKMRRKDRSVSRSEITGGTVREYLCSGVDGKRLLARSPIGTSPTALSKKRSSEPFSGRRSRLYH